MTKGKFTLALMPLLLAAGAARGDIIAWTSFEEPLAIGGLYSDTLDPATNHFLLNNIDDPIVNYTFGGGELGFTSYYTNTRGDVGLTDGDFVGVTDFAGSVGAFTDGIQGFQLNDTDGLVTTTLDMVSLLAPGFFNVSLDLFVVETGWETGTVSDRIRIWVEVDGGVQIDLLNTAGADIDSLGIEGSWMTLAADLTGYTRATLHFELDSNAVDEAIFIDNIYFSGNIPAPGILAVFGVAGLLAGRGRRRR